jgi:hypothetical protein
MNNKKIQSALQDALEQKLPSSEIRLGPAIQADLLARNHSFAQQGEKMKTFKRPQHAALITLTALFLLTLTFVTPQGRALAQSILRFFTRADSDTFYVEPSDRTVEETTPFLEECGSWIRPTCSLEQIRSKIDFEVKELGILPAGMHFGGATGGPDNIGFAYVYEDRDRLGGQLSVSVEPVDSPSTWLVARSANVEQVQIGNLLGEYYTGTLFQDEQGNVTWQPNDPQMTLRWEDDGSRYTMYYYSTRYPLTREDLVRLAESMTPE